MLPSGCGRRQHQHRDLPSWPRVGRRNAIALVEIDGTVSPDLLGKVQQIPNVQQVKPLRF